jgi:hypothetical protein
VKITATLELVMRCLRESGVRVNWRPTVIAGESKAANYRRIARLVKKPEFSVRSRILIPKTILHETHAMKTLDCQKLDVIRKTWSNIFGWRGQVAREFVEQDLLGAMILR